MTVEATAPGRTHAPIPDLPYSRTAYRSRSRAISAPWWDSSSWAYARAVLLTVVGAFGLSMVVIVGIVVWYLRYGTVRWFGATVLLFMASGVMLVGLAIALIGQKPRIEPCNDYGFESAFSQPSGLFHIGCDYVVPGGALPGERIHPQLAAEHVLVRHPSPFFFIWLNMSMLYTLVVPAALVVLFQGRRRAIRLRTLMWRTSAQEYF
jgi:hypothetical protein